MKIAIPVEEKNPETNVCASFGRAPYFFIYDTETKEKLFLDNSAAASTGGAGIKAAQTIADQGACALLTSRDAGKRRRMCSKAPISRSIKRYPAAPRKT